MNHDNAIESLVLLRGQGQSRTQIREQVHRGELSRLRRGVLERPTPTPPGAEDRYRQLVAAVGHAAGDPLISHLSAAVLWELPIVGGDKSVVHTTAGTRNGGQRRAGVHRHVVHRDDHVHHVDGLRVTSLTRTLVDVARTAPLTTSVPMIDAALRRDAVSLDSLAEDLRAAGRQRGVERARHALGLADSRCESPGESVSRVVMDATGIQLPITQVKVYDAEDRFLGRCDFWFEGTATLGEFDGLMKYGDIPDGPDGRDALVREKIREDSIRRTNAVIARWLWVHLWHGRSLASILLPAIEQGRRALESGMVTATFRPA